MKCPVCSHEDSAVLRTDQTPDAIRRRRQCSQCGHRWNTFETCEDATAELVKFKQLLTPVAELLK